MSDEEDRTSMRALVVFAHALTLQTGLEEAFEAPGAVQIPEQGHVLQIVQQK